MVTVCFIIIKHTISYISHTYPRVTSFDALKQSTGICAHLITISSRKYIMLNKLSCSQSKHTF